MLVVGLTGGIATGKSSVSRLLQSPPYSVPLVDADLIARQVVEPGTKGLKRIVKAFGEDILLPDGSLDRKKLGSIIFNDPAKRKILNGIVHPAVRWEMFRQVLKFWFKGSKYVILDIPLLVEGGLWKLVGDVVVVYCSEDLQLHRLMLRDNSTREEALSRVNSQFPISDKAHYADYIVDNSGGMKELEDHVALLVHRLEQKTGSFRWRLQWILPPYALFSATWCLFLRWVKRRKQKKTQ